MQQGRSFRHLAPFALLPLFLSLHAQATPHPSAAPSSSVHAQTSPDRSAPSQPPIPALPKTERTEAPRGQTDQYSLSEDRSKNALAYSPPAYTLYFRPY